MTFLVNFMLQFSEQASISVGIKRSREMTDQSDFPNENATKKSKDHLEDSSNLRAVSSPEDAEDFTPKMDPGNLMRRMENLEFLNRLELLELLNRLEEKNTKLTEAKDRIEKRIDENNKQIESLKNEIEK